MKLNLKARTPSEARVLAWLESNADAALAARIEASGRTLADALEHCREEACKLRRPHGASCVCVDDTTVYGWAAHYFQDLAAPAEAPAEAQDDLAGQLQALDGLTGKGGEP
jgi:hypothetical protein